MVVLRALFLAINGCDLEIAFTMSDEDAALRKALESNFPNSLQLSCYFHLLQNIQKKFKNKPGYVEAVTFIRDCHHTKSYFHYVEVYNNFMEKYDTDEYLNYRPVVDYLILKCAESSYAKNFQMYLTPSGILIQLIQDTLQLTIH